MVVAARSVADSAAHLRRRPRRRLCRLVRVVGRLGADPIGLTPFERVTMQGDNPFSPVALQQHTETDRIVAAREQYVARGISTTDLVVARAEGARIWDVDGREYLDFAGGIACKNAGHGFPAAVAAIHEQVDRYLHQCFMVGIYEPYVEVCRRLAELSPCSGDAQRSLLLNSGAEAIENAAKIARAATGRPAVVVFENSFHGRTLLTMTMTGHVRAIEHFMGVAPDLLVSGKSLGGGLPLAGVTGRAEVMDAVDPGGLGGTFGGNPVACAAALAVLDEVASPAFRARADEVGRV